MFIEGKDNDRPIWSYTTGRNTNLC
jgi:hypothetical protein